MCNSIFTFCIGHDRLLNPQPSDIREGLSVAPYPDPELTEGCEPFATLKIVEDEDEVEVVFVGVEAGLVVKTDFDEWKKHMMVWLTQTYKTFGLAFCNLKGELIQWATGMLWQDQSYACIRKFRFHHTAGWSGFHLARFNMFAGEY